MRYALRCIQLEIVSTYHGSLEYKEATISVDTEKPYVTTVSWGFYRTFHRTKQKKEMAIKEMGKFSTHKHSFTEANLTVSLY